MLINGVWNLLFLPFYLVYLLPAKVQEFLGRLIGLFWFDVLRVRRKTAIENIKLAYPQLSHAEAVQMARQSLIHMGYNIIEIFCFPFLDCQTILKNSDFKDLNKLEDALKEKRGVFLLTAHIGNGDYATAGFSCQGLKMNLISKEFKYKGLNNFWFQVRKKFGTQMIAPKKSTYEILKALKRQETVIFVLDQYTGPPNGIVTEFFGKKTGTAFGLALLAQRAGAVVVPAYTYRKDFSQHVIQILDPVQWVEPAEAEEAILTNTQKYCDVVEHMIRQKPEQWMWVHRRWKNHWVQTESGDYKIIKPNPI